MAKLTLTNTSGGHATKNNINANNDLIEAAVENTLSRDGTGPNSMSAPLDMGSNKIINLANASANQEAVTKAQLDAYAANTLTSYNASAGTFNPAGYTSQTIENKLKEVVSIADYGAVADSNGTTTSGTDNLTAIQAALDAINAAGGGGLYIPSGIYRVSDTIRAYANTTIYGGGPSSHIYFDTSDFGSTAGKTGDFDDFKQAAIVFHSGDFPTFVTTRSYSGTTPIENCIVRDIKITSNGSYTGVFRGTHSGIRFHGCKNSYVYNVYASGFLGVPFYANEYGDNVSFIGNYATECPHNGFNYNGRIHNSRICGNRTYKVGQPIEITGWDNIVSENIFSVYDMNGIFVSDDTLGYELSCNITNNRIIDGDNHTLTPILLQGGSGVVESIIISNNYIRGKFLNGITISSGNTGKVICEGNVVIEEATANMGACISVTSASARSFISNNICTTTTAFPYSAISAASATSLATISNNHINSTSALRGAATNFGGVIQHQATTPAVAIINNYLDGQLLHSPIYSFTDADTTPSIKYCDRWKTSNTGATTITSFDDGIAGQVIVIIFGDANTTIDFTGTTLKGNAGVDFTGAVGDHMTCIFDGTNWYCNVSDNTV